MHSSSMRTVRSSSRRGGGGSPHIPPPAQDQVHPPGPGTPAPAVDRHIPVNILPCPKLRLRAVKILRCRQLRTHPKSRENQMTFVIRSRHASHLFSLSDARHSEAENKVMHVDTLFMLTPEHIVFLPILSSSQHLQEEHSLLTGP